MVFLYLCFNVPGINVRKSYAEILKLNTNLSRFYGVYALLAVRICTLIIN